MLECSQPSSIMSLHHLCKCIHFLSPVGLLFIPSLYYAFFDSENFYLLVYWCFNSALLCLGKSRQQLTYKRLMTAQCMAWLRPSRSYARSASRCWHANSHGTPSPVVRSVNSDFKNVVRNVIQPTVRVINIAADHQMFMTLTGERSWQRLRRSAVGRILKKRKNRSLSHPLGDLGVTYALHLYLQCTT